MDLRLMKKYFLDTQFMKGYISMRCKHSRIQWSIV